MLLIKHLELAIFTIQKLPAIGSMLYLATEMSIAQLLFVHSRLSPSLKDAMFSQLFKICISHQTLRTMHSPTNSLKMHHLSNPSKLPNNQTH